MDASHVYVRALALGCFYKYISTGTFGRALTASVDSCAKIKSAHQEKTAVLTKMGGGGGGDGRRGNRERERERKKKAE